MSVSPSVTTFLFEAANFLVLAAALGWFLFQPVRQALADQRKKFESDNLLASKKLEEAEQAQQAVNETRANLQAELHQLRAREIELARQQAEQIVTDARKEAERERELSRRRATQMSDLQRDTLAEVTATTAAETVGRLLTQISGPDLQTALIASACQQLQLLPSGRMAPAKVESTQPLTLDQLSTIKAALGSAADTADFKIVDDIGNGVRISTAQGLIDASVKGLVQFARQSLVQEMSHRAQDHQPLQSVNDV